MRLMWRFLAWLRCLFRPRRKRRIREGRDYTASQISTWSWGGAAVDRRPAWPRSRWTNHTKSPYRAKAKARRKTAHESRRRNRAG